MVESLFIDDIIGEIVESLLDIVCVEKDLCCDFLFLDLDLEWLEEWL